MKSIIIFIFLLISPCVYADTIKDKIIPIKQGSTQYLLMQHNDKRWVICVSYGSYGNSLAALYFQKKNTPETALENSLSHYKTNKKEIFLTETAKCLKSLWNSVGVDINPYAFEDLIVSKKELFSKLLFGRTPFSITDDGYFKISGVFPQFWCSNRNYGLWETKNTFDFFYNDDLKTWINASDGLNEPMPMFLNVTTEDWIEYVIEQKNQIKKKVLPLPDKYDSKRANKLFKQNIKQKNEAIAAGTAD
ncbi:MAG: hypothetical protein K6B46_05635 [Opitutales bacterium]|nr:hypothetical protein [Opitutales bacterium]